ncbi:PadR family transcriptional regulator PadR [Sedimentibacter acidaminivorans]|uniref:PadR family transcriptional regulator PadR n=1 Tax=Sedimentibacter acidaminivorans TaxID=913099 RepID=A0ABS4GB42_9FIRM|nr:PadR family transcriptional regulator [Sedimentibacter acidaminivorans]MBP1924904.1 PadR family transcriptional regulator PadR [Sedimentibacter acidaminivorans]
MKVDKSLISGSTKMLVLSIIEGGDKYGYEIIQELNLKSYGTFVVKEGTLYPILHSLEKEGLIKSYPYKMENGRTRKYHKITKKGKTYLYTKKKEWNEFSTKVNMIIGSNV